ncbi:Mce-associated membrane protein [Saccharopolyspora erythraea NRRL 2338]|uniref:Uncharacterized protein n=2 Tax=Saccharopolyspora erythraea TaxID=1836 RepID=A4FPP6_SACEN|nr:hypothetical protein [Saccharopolyspora erythraea]EQD86906.1 hypothetical protein N599_06920 [Saccharopolyspora erythraea D]PFG99666.1 Mce-associated membrane protein [Saccharopolyspora erythraea NRRL 2338]QRK89553.1 hypothetical protein JQX30_34320 [Saccharopolyspora erythraea]CAM06021.1 hypothetical protein SACE_6857 [Saccharopolyspora erythraea NRRL 2338]
MVIENPRRNPRWGVVAASAALAVSVISAGFFGVSWASVANSGSLEAARERDAALEAGRQAVVNFNTLDFRDVQHGLDLWVDSSTGPLRDQIQAGRQANAAKISEARTVTDGKVLDAALTELDPQAGKARMIAVVEVTVAPENQPPAVKRNRYQAELARDGDRWKLSNLGTVAVG